MAVPIYCTQDRGKVLREVQQWTLTGLALFLSA